MASKKRPSVELNQYVHDLVQEYKDSPDYQSKLEHDLIQTRLLIELYLGRNRQSPPNLSNEAYAKTTSYAEFLKSKKQPSEPNLVIDLDAIESDAPNHFAKGMISFSSPTRDADQAHQPYDFDSMPLAEHPPNMTVRLSDYQLQALQWMLNRQGGCILADEMGLGKTVQAIALMHARPVPLTLLSVPVSLIDQWCQEIVAKTCNAKFVIIKYHGAKRDEAWQRLQKLIESKTTIPIIVVTSHMLLGKSGIKMVVKPTKYNKRVEYDFSQNPLMSICWSRVIIDEAHMLRAQKSLTHQGACALQREGTLLLTGTPLTNCLDDFQALLAVLKHRYADSKLWHSEIVSWLGTRHGDSKLRMMTEQVMLRRHKGQVICGTPITTLPTVEQIVIELELVKDSAEEVFYSAIENNVAIVFSSIDSVSITSKQTLLLTLLLRLRQAACHPFILGMSSLARAYYPSPLPSPKKLDWNLIQNTCQQMIDQYCNGGALSDFESARINLSLDTLDYSLAPTDGSTPNIAPARKAPIITMQNASSKLSKALEIVQSILSQSADEKIIIFSQFTTFLDIVEYCLMQSIPDAGFARIDGKTPAIKRGVILDRFKTVDTQRILLLSLKAGGVGLDLSVANHVLLLDAWWNSAVEMQAQDRVSRIGQQKNVKIYRFYVKGTVEAHVERIKAKKDVMIRDAFHLGTLTPSKNALIDAPNLTMQEIQSMMIPIIRTK